MKPCKYPYLGFKKPKQSVGVDKLDLVVFPNVAIKKDLLKYVQTVVKVLDSTTDIYFKIPNFFSYKEQRIRVDLSYEETLELLNSY
ncbi:TPA: hypothetical protein VCY54_001498 [Streptococcus pyogenes]|nr:hypothetical protein [Streptococcus pyogenes]